jgi:hypothetical protein
MVGPGWAEESKTVTLAAFPESTKVPWSGPRTGMLSGCPVSWLASNGWAGHHSAGVRLAEEDPASGQCGQDARLKLGGRLGVEDDHGLLGDVGGRPGVAHFPPVTSEPLQPPGPVYGCGGVRPG